MLSVRDLRLNVNKKEILKGISFDIPSGSITTIVGKSGAGKSTLLSCITQLQPNYSGTIYIDGRGMNVIPPAERAQLVGLVFQQCNLFAHMTVLQNCAQQLRVLQGLTASQAEAQALEMLEYFKVAEYKDCYPNRLSGGQQQRVALARALVMQPKILCLDEPTSALDSENVDLLVTLLRQLNANGTTIIVTSHDSRFIEKLGGQLLCVEEGSLLPAG